MKYNAKKRPCQLLLTQPPISETEVFSTDLIGKGTTGGYIVLQKKDGIECMKIENLTDHTLKVVIEASKETNRNGNSSAIFILKRIR